MKVASSYGLKMIALVVFLCGGIHAQSGSLDPLFGTGGVASVSCSGSIQEAVMQSDGKIITLFMNLSSGSHRIVRFNTDGSPDASFGAGGVSTFNWPAAGGGSGQPIAMSLQTSAGVDKIIVAGYTKMLVRNKAADALRVDRFLPDGSLDLTFGSGGSAILQVPSALAVAVQSDGKIVAVGDLGQLVRLNANGGLDATFGAGGTANGNSLIYPNPNAIAVQPNDKIVIAGYSTSKNKTLATVARYNSNGSVDTTFGSGGRATADFAGGKAWDVAVSPDGSIVSSGTSGTTTNTQNAVVARFTSAGRLDNSFGANGVASFDSGYGDVGWRMGIQPDGKVLVSGNVGGGPIAISDLLTVRFDPAGNLDFPFGISGGTITDVYGGGETSRGVFIQNIGTADIPDFRVLVAGMTQASGNETRAIVVRYFY